METLSEENYGQYYGKFRTNAPRIKVIVCILTHVRLFIASMCTLKSSSFFIRFRIAV